MARGGRLWHDPQGIGRQGRPRSFSACSKPPRARRVADRDPGAQAGRGRLVVPEVTKRAIDWAIVGVAVRGDPVGLVNMASTPLRAAAVEQALAGGASVAEAAPRAAERTGPPADINAGRGYREHLARVLVGRALDESQTRS